MEEKKSTRDMVSASFGAAHANEKNKHGHMVEARERERPSVWKEISLIGLTKARRR
jgi:hypothetical protein